MGNGLTIPEGSICQDWCEDAPWIWPCHERLRGFSKLLKINWWKSLLWFCDLIKHIIINILANLAYLLKETSLPSSAMIDWVTGDRGGCMERCRRNSKNCLRAIRYYARKKYLSHYVRSKVLSSRYPALLTNACWVQRLVSIAEISIYERIINNELCNPIQSSLVLHVAALDVVFIIILVHYLSWTNIIL